MYVYNIILYVLQFGACGDSPAAAVGPRVLPSRLLLQAYGYARRRSKRTRICAIIYNIIVIVRSTFKRNLLCSRCTRFGRSSSRSLETGKIRQMCDRVYLTLTFLVYRLRWQLIRTWIFLSFNIL